MIKYLLQNPLLLYCLIAVVVAILAFVIYKLFSGNKKNANGSAQQVYIGNLSYRVREHHLRDYFSQFGDISQLRIIKNHNTGRSKGFGFITFSSASSATQSLQAHGKNFEGRSLVVRFAKPK